MSNISMTNRAPETKLLPADAICGEIAHLCVCAEPAGHEGPHVCMCEGQWLGTIGGPDFKIVQLPGTKS